MAHLPDIVGFDQNLNAWDVGMEGLLHLVDTWSQVSAGPTAFVERETELKFQVNDISSEANKAKRYV